MSIKKLTKRIWYGSDTTVDSEGKTVAAAPPVATNDGSKDWDLKGLVRGELYLNDNKDDPALFFLGSDNVPRRIEGKGSSFTGYWTLVTTNAAGEALEEGKEYILSDYTAVSKKDIVAYGVGDGEDYGFPVAGASQLGLVGVKSGGGVIVDSDGYISIDPSYAGGGSGISQITSSGTGNAVTSLTYDGSTKTLTYVKGNTFALASQIPTSLKNPYALSWSGYSTGTYDGSAAKTLSIPNNTNQLTNGAGFIKDGNGNFTTLTGSGSSTKYLAGNGTFYTIAYSELSGTPDLTIYMPKAGGTFTGNVNMNTGSTFPYYRVTNSVGWAQLAGTSGTYLGSALSGIIQSSLAFAIMGRNSSPNMVVFDGGTVKASKDVVAFASSDADDLIAIATTDMYGLVKIDGTTIKVNSSGQIYAAGGGSTVSASASYTSGTSIGTVTIDGTKTTFYVPNKVGTSTVGGTARPIYLSSGTPTACSSTVGGTSKPVYMSSGTVTACTATVGSASLPVYMSSGSLTACTASSLFSALSYSGSTLSITVAGQTRTATISGGSGSWNGGSVSNTIITPKLWVNTSSSSYTLAVNGTVNVQNTAEFRTNLIVYTTGNLTATRIQGNSINSWSPTSTGRPRLWLNYYKQSGWSYQSEIFIGNGDGAGTQVATINADGDGKILVKNGTGTLSDIRYKRDIRAFEKSVLSVIGCFEPFYYKTLDDDIEQIGFSAQAVQAVFPQFVSGTDPLSLDYERFAAVISIQGIKELYRKHTALDNIVRSRRHWELTKDQQIKHLQDTVIRLQQEIEDLKGGVAA